MDEWYSGIYKAFILASSISFLISFFTSGVNSYGSILTGYSTLVLGIMMILLILFNNIFRVTQNTAQSLLTILTTTGPFLLMLGVIGFILYLVIMYKNIIVNGNVAPSYYTFSKIAIILFLAQTFLVYNNLNTEQFNKSGKLTKVTSSLLYLLGVLTLMCSFILYITLKYFVADGFQNFK